MTIYAVATDEGMSGWGGVKRSFVACKCETDDELTAALAQLNKRPEFKRVRTNLRLPTLRAGDHLSIFTPETHPAWFGAN